MKIPPATKLEYECDEYTERKFHAGQKLLTSQFSFSFFFSILPSHVLDTRKVQFQTEWVQTIYKVQYASMLHVGVL